MDTDARVSLLLLHSITYKYSKSKSLLIEHFKRNMLYHQISLPIILFYTVCTKPQPFFTFWIATEITLSSQTYQTAP